MPVRFARPDVSKAFPAAWADLGRYHFCFGCPIRHRLAVPLVVALPAWPFSAFFSLRFWFGF
jgi:hypothetical protein